ncbi:hypothetical protein BDP55DRAFT_722810 [Colletotrichum godetiae]|uniref:Mid2 domain-containing protein n=1 Tax=Colletotrichum godetiae TaxID=1209918 RepID=A0AAJ0EZL9_9PEZI|nr:uncharacterized protein BDP55DRAFT_722810 [Colletotrichum godetiae]KAK1700243.1 hypothetical protein BDP55DRAFT_722810 [Colletotrichum godetiae]
MRLATIIFLCLWSCICNSSVFRRPPGAGPTGDFRDNPTYVIGEILDLQWDSDDNSAVDLTIIQVSEDILDIPRTTYLFPRADLANQQRTTYNWQIRFDGFPSSHDPNLSDIYFFRLLPAGVGGAGSTSHYFNITSNAASSVPSSSSTSVSATTVTSTTTNTPKSGDGGLAGGAVAGIAIGVMIGTLAVVGVVFILVRRRWKKTKRGRQIMAGPTAAGGTEEVHFYKRDMPAPSREVYGESRRFEAEGSGPSDMRFEMSGDVVERRENMGLGQGSGHHY